MITVPAGKTAFAFFQITKLSPPRALLAVVAEDDDKKPLSVNLIIVFGNKSTHVTNAKLSGALTLKPMIDKSPTANTVGPGVMLADKPVG